LAFKERSGWIIFLCLVSDDKPGFLRSGIRKRSGQASPQIPWTDAV
jgi:hypothetical protein